MNRRQWLAGAAALGLLTPAVAHAQARATPLIGFLHGSALVAQYHAFIDSFLGGLREQGFEPQRDVAIEFRWAEGRYERVVGLAAELLALRPNMAVVYGPPGVLRAAIDAMPSSLPIVFGTGGDPVAAGIVPSLARPGGNVTGVANRTNTLDVKRIELLRDLLPHTFDIGLILNPDNSDAAAVEHAAREGARSLGRRLIVTGAATERELEAAFESLTRQGVGALLIGSDTFLSSLRDKQIELAARYRLPTMHAGREFVEAGGLISYGASFNEAYRQIGIYAGRVLAGTRPADLPVLEPSRFELAINLKTARVLGLSVAPAILARADEVIE